MTIYSVTVPSAARQVVSASFKTQISVAISTFTPKRFSVTEFAIGAVDVPNATDCAIEWEMARIGSQGSGTAYTVPFLKPLDVTTTQVPPASTVLVGQTGEPTMIANTIVVSGAMNQRSFVRWVAAERDAEPEAAVSSIIGTGLALRVQSTNFGGKVATTLNFRE